MKKWESKPDFLDSEAQGCPISEKIGGTWNDPTRFYYLISKLILAVQASSPYTFSFPALFRLGYNLSALRT